MSTIEDDSTVMLVDVTGAVLKHIRSSHMYANLSGHQVDYIAFLSYQGTYLARVKMIKKRVPLNEIYPESESRSRTTLYKLGTLEKYPLRRNSKIPRGRKRVTSFSKFKKAKETSELFRSRRD